MYVRLILAAVGFIFVADIDLARADWLDDAWGDRSTALHGNPAITVHPDGVSVVLPAETLDEALSQRGMTRRDALRAFLGRYSPQCSHVLDLNTARQNLAVELRIQAATPLEDLPAKSLDEIVMGMETIKVPTSKAASKDRRAQIPRVEQVFTTLPERFDFTIDYAPDKVARCIVPQDSIS
jgi:hypothetical protein